MGVVAEVGIDFVVHTSFAVHTSFMVHTGSVVHIGDDTDSDTIFVGKAQDGSVLAPVHPEPSRHSSSNRCLLSSPSKADMLYNPSQHALLIYKIYRKGWLGYLKSSTSIDNPHHDALYFGIFCTRVVLGYSMD